jgi:hypothetical protein
MPELTRIHVTFLSISLSQDAVTIPPQMPKSTNTNDLWIARLVNRPKSGRERTPKKQQGQHGLMATLPLVRDSCLLDDVLISGIVSVHLFLSNAAGFAARAPT